MNEIVMPKLSDTMTEGRLVAWKKQVGDRIQRGEVLAEVETDKANMELEAYAEGVLREIRVQAGEMAAVGTVIAVIDAAEQTAALAAQTEPAGTPTAQGPATAAASARAAGGGESQAEATGPGPARGPAVQAAGAPPETAAPPVATPGSGAGTALEVSESRAAAQTTSEAPVAAAAPTAGSGAGVAQAPASDLSPHTERAAPVVRRRARELGIDLGQVSGSGAEGRILLSDLENLQPTEGTTAGKSEAPAVPPTAGPAPDAGAGKSVALSTLRRAVARTVAESWRTIPHFSVSTEVLMDGAEAVRRQLKGGGIAVSLNDLIVKAVCLTLQQFPRLNASFGGETVQLHEEVNIGIAVGLPDGVLLPVIPRCQRLSLQQIAENSRHLVERARSGGLSEAQMGGGTFSVSNLGMYGVSQFSAIVYPSQSGVLAVGAVRDAVVASLGVPAVARVMNLTLSADHRVVDGAYAAEFLAHLKDILENPVRLLV